MKDSEFLELLKEKNIFFRNKDFYVKSKFINYTTKIIVKDKYGYLRMTPQSLLRGSKPSIKSALFKTQYFKNQLHQKSKNYYKRKYKIISRYETAHKHILVETKYGTHYLLSSGLLLNKMPTIDSAVDKNKFALNYMKDIHKDRYSYPNFKYKNAKEKLEVFCNKTKRTFYRSFDSHKKTKDNSYFSKNFNTKTFIEKAKKVHSNKYDYSLVDYINAKQKVKIICKKHGIFEQTPNSHLSKQGCKYCKVILGSFKSWEKVSKNRKGILYIIECYNEEERFIKVGITSKSIDERFYKNKLMPYNYKVIHECKDHNLYNVWSNERFIKKLYKIYKYKPKIKFAGYTECFDINCKNLILNFIKNFEIVNSYKNYGGLWHLLAKCELYIKENNIDIKEYSKKYLKKLAQNNNK